MEDDDRDRFVVIAAGYPEPMQRSSTQPRCCAHVFTTTIDFAAYSATDLVKIAGSDGRRIQVTGSPATHNGVLENILAVLDARGPSQDPSFGNVGSCAT